MHWGYDIGAAHVTRALVRQSAGWGVLSRFSRLLCDPNRDPDDPTLVLQHCDEGSPSFNRTLGDVARRVSRFHAPFHEAVGSAMRAAPPRFLVSVHSFTPVFRGNSRDMEAGVLFDRHDDLAERLVRSLNDAGLRTEPNAPYSGKDGLIYSAQRHGGGEGVPYLEIELRQDLLSGERRAQRVARRVWRALQALEPVLSRSTR
jgi:predicted N-formylglutamate amidohydrolase